MAVARHSGSWEAPASKHPKRVEPFERSLERQRVPAAVSLVSLADQAVCEISRLRAIVVERGPHEVPLLDLESACLEDRIENANKLEEAS